MSKTTSSLPFIHKDKGGKYKKLTEDVSYQNASWFSRLMFSWIKPVLTIGNERPIMFDDLPELPYFFNYLIYRQDKMADVVKNKFKENWEKELEKEKYSN